MTAKTHNRPARMRRDVWFPLTVALNAIPFSQSFHEKPIGQLNQTRLPTKRIVQTEAKSDQHFKWI